MIVSADPPLHLTYCLNIHPGQTWAESFAAIEGKALRVRQAVAPGRRFGLGLRLSNEAAVELSEPDTLREFARFLEAHDLYVFTINGFPYGQFHATAVKEDVYRPDWRTGERRDYTLRLIDILAELLPEGVAGSISTVPGAYKAWVRTREDVRRMCRMLAQAAAHADEVRERTGRDICIALEPEPDCFIEDTDEAIALFTEALPDVAGPAVSRHVGLCFDTAHAAVQFERPAESLRRIAAAGVRIGKVQLSSALRLDATAASVARLRDFADAVYLHQVKLRRRDGAVRSFPDLAEAMMVFEGGGEAGDELRVHFHVPLFFDRAGGLESTSSLLDEAFWALLSDRSAAPTSHLEIETYTFDVLPAHLRPEDVTESIAREFQWVLARLSHGQTA